jgi:hypothetical protein
VHDNIGIDLGWLVMSPQETVILTVDMTTLQQRVKHFSWKQRRFFLCVGQGCDFCMRGTPKRLRYQVRVAYDGCGWWWEFGKRVYKQVKQQAGEDESVQLLITRIDSGRSTRYWIKRVGEESPLPGRERQVADRCANITTR